jgi:hypothetical protein
MKTWQRLIRPALALLDTVSMLGMLILFWDGAIRLGIPSPAGFAVLVTAFIRWLALEVIAKDRKPWQKVFYRSRRDEGIGE